MKYLKLAILLSIFASVAIFFEPKLFKDFGSAAWFILCFIMIIRPLSEVFPGFPILKKGVLLRRELGIACASFAITHAVGLFLMLGISPLVIITDPANYWGISNFITWGILGLLISLPLLLTSNMYSMKLLKQNWKKVQKLSYVLFIFVAIHISLIHPSLESFFENGLPVIIWAILWILAYKKKVLY